MSLLLIAPGRDMVSLKKAIHDIDTDINVIIWPDVDNKKRVQFAVAWQQPPHVFSQFPNLQTICSLGAGADHLLTDKTLPENLSICRIVSSELVQQMKEYVFNAILNYQRQTYSYMRQRQRNTWNVRSNIKEIPIGIMGLGQLGEPVAYALANFGYHVSGWAKSKKIIKDVHTFSGIQELLSFLSQTAILICMLPLTPETNDILDLRLFRHIQHPGYLINVARGEHLVEEDLIYALDKGWLEGACLDVFQHEPLPQHHPFWNRSNIMITPHVSSITQSKKVAPQIVENYKRALSGMPLINEVDQQKGY